MGSGRSRKTRWIGQIEHVLVAKADAMTFLVYS
jgi:hypothetical protein